MTVQLAPPGSSRTESAKKWHLRRLGQMEADAKREATLSSRVANLRFVLFVAFIGVLAWAEAETVGELGVWLAAVPLAGFVAAIVAHQKIRERQRRYDAGGKAHGDAIRRAERDWEHVEHLEYSAADSHPYAHDIDVVGRASLAHLLSAVRTPAGRMKLQTWLLKASTRDAILQRQSAVAELASRRAFRESIEVAARLHVKPNVRSHTDLVKWLDETAWLPRRTWLVWFGRVSTGFVVVLATLHLAGIVPYALWLVPIIVNFVLSRGFMGEIHPIFQRATSGEGALVAYEHVLHLFSVVQFESPWLRELQSHVRGEGWAAPAAISRFRSLASLAEVRRSFVGPILQGLMLWDVFVLRRLEHWRARHTEANRWFDVAAEVEVLNAFGALSDDNPGWCTPAFTEGDGAFIAKGIGHPLLPATTCVTNDVTIGPSGTFVFVTGSNMSGKSTLLRAVGCNVVLAQAGAPVCCQALTLPTVQLYTNMRVTDSLATGESYYLAALRRLKLVIDAAQDNQAPEPQVMYLLDEILQGTNSAERKIAVQGVLRELLGSRAIGAITSHDLSLIDQPDLESVATSVHFLETVREVEGKTVMSFDYKLRSGVAPTRNALRLMEIIGLRGTKNA